MVMRSMSRPPCLLANGSKSARVARYLTWVFRARLRSATRCSRRNRRTHGPRSVSSFMIASDRVLGEALTGCLQEFRRHLEVTLGRSDIEVTEIGSELRKQSLDVLAGAVPRDDTVHGCGIAKIMQARRARFAERAVDTGSSSHVLEH